MQKEINRLLYDYLMKTGIGEQYASYLNLFILLIGAIVVAGLLDLIIWRILRSISVRLARKTSIIFDNFLVAHKVHRYLAHIVPLLLLFELVPLVFADFEYGANIAEKILQILFVLLALFMVKSIFRSITKPLWTTCP
jgi:miniconductance mechanosensitive channel